LDEKTNHPVDTRLAGSGEAADVFRSPPAEDPIAQDQFDAPHEHLFPGVRADYLGLVRDDTVLPSKENDAWFHLFELLSAKTDNELRRASEGKVEHVQLYNQPRAYRGHLVTVSGRLRSAQYLEATANSYGVAGYYKLAIETGRSSNPPIVIGYVLDLPKALRAQNNEQRDLSEQVRLTGFFFKRLAYKAQDTIRLAPLLVGKSLDWTPPPAPAQPQSEAGSEIVSGVIVGLVLLGLVALAIRRSAVRSSKAGTSQRFVMGSAKSTTSTADPTDFLKDLACQRDPESLPSSHVEAR